MGTWPAIEQVFVPAKTRDGPGWITHPRPTERITGYWVDGAGAAKIGWGTPGDFNRCRANLAKYVQNPDWLAGLCANLHYRALRIWPGQHRGALVASAAQVNPPREWFQDPGLTHGTTLQVTPEGRVYGHLALWGVCHLASGECVTTPHSASDYAFFNARPLDTDDGTVYVGPITVGGGHADIFLSHRGALSHYDSLSTIVADVVVGEDEFGIWFSGALRDVDAKMRKDLRSASLSGDWRPIGDDYELIAALAVAVPGFPIPRPSMSTVGGKVFAITAAGVLPQDPDLVRAARRVLSLDYARHTMGE